MVFDNSIFFLHMGSAEEGQIKMTTAQPDVVKVGDRRCCEYVLASVH